jgi:septation ring formation regulator EzrA
MYVFRLFQFRSPDRDQETDKRRIALVQKAVRSAVTDAEAEVKGLQTRIAKARTSVTSILAQIEDGDPDPACRAQLTNVEQRLLAGERRLVQMKDHVARLRELEGVAARLTSVMTSATPHVTVDATTVTHAVGAEDALARINGGVKAMPTDHR